MNLGAMVRLVIEKVTDGNMRLLDVISTTVVGVRERLLKKVGVQALEERLDKLILIDSGGPQIRKIIEQDSVERWRDAVMSLKPCHP